ncbi:MAG: acetyl-CoA carboxylase carboxyltransferase subunit alpha [Verrucomicrobiales bacterium]
MNNVTPLPFEKPLVDLQKQLEDLRKQSDSNNIDLEIEIKNMQVKLEETRRNIYQSLTPWQRVQIARHTARPFALDYIQACFTDFVELHGDRLFGDDASMPAGLATIKGHRCVVVTNQKGRDLKENLKRNFGSAHPEGYRKALRVMRLAEKFSLPVIALIDTPGAYPGVGAEERHIAESIAVNLREMMLLKVPIVAAVLGEGGSGGALGIGVANRVLILENAYYSVISPEACSAILWKDRKHAAEAAEALKLTATDLKRFELVDEIIPEPMGGAHHDPQAMAQTLATALVANLETLQRLSLDELLEDRYAKFRKFGEFSADGLAVAAQPA